MSKAERKSRNDVTRCRHTVDTGSLEALKDMLRNLPDLAPALLETRGVPLAGYDDMLTMAVESMRGQKSASPKAKQQFIKAVLDHMAASNVVDEWEFVGSGSRQDYRVKLTGGFQVGIEAKGCGDGNNLTIWDRPSWAQEFVIWSLCPDSLQYHPGHGVWSALSTRLAPKMIHEKKHVDAFIYYDGRCGSEFRPCPKAFGVHGIRARATDIPGQSSAVEPGSGFGLDWLPPPSIYLLPQTLPEAPRNSAPQPHTPRTCRFAAAMLSAFNVPEPQMPEYVETVHITVEMRQDGVYRRLAVHHGRSESPAFESSWELIKR